VATEVTRIQIRSRDDRPVPIQVDGDYIGDVAEIEFSVEPGALRVVC
jgi:diacylglycerol kinase family enzyme